MAEDQGKEPLLEQILEALKATEESTSGEDPSQNLAVENNEEKDDQNEEPSVEEEADGESNKVSKVVAALEKLEQVHREQRKDLLEANEELQNPGVAKVSKMQRKIHSVKKNLETEEKKVLNLLDQPNSDGNTVMHITTSMDDDEATQLLLVHGANPNVQDVNGNSPLHTICDQGDIQTATHILENNGGVLENKLEKTPALDTLFFDKDEAEVKKMMEAVCQSNHRKEILEDILRKKHLLFRLVENDKSTILSLVLKKLSSIEQEEYVNLVRDTADGNTCLHLASSSNSIQCTSILLEAGAKLKTNATGLLPKIEDFLTWRNDDQITSALIDGVLERVKANQLDQEKALELLLPEDEHRKIPFLQASGKTWSLVADWCKRRDGETTDLSHVYPRMSVSELEKMVVVAKDGHWDKTNAFTFLCAEDKDGRLFLSRLSLKIQTEAAVWNQEGINQIVHKIDKELLQWIIQQANDGSWDRDWLANAVCQKSSDKRPKLLLFDEEAQKELACMDKSKTCQIIPWLGSSLQEWIYQEATEGRWDQDMVFRFLERGEKDGAEVVSLKLYPGRSDMNSI